METGEKIECKNCGKWFIKKHRRQSTCCEECKAEYKNKQNREAARLRAAREKEMRRVQKRHCVICGTFFSREKGPTFKCKCCGAEHYRLGVGKTRFCAQCGKVFEVKDGRRYYCSEECKKAEAAQSPEKIKKARKLSISDIQRAAKQEGSSYGEYVAKHGL
jgi:hypothetical protein